ncbi:tumor necrosis factor receptor superfamily, member a [Aplochiton taeniatus]
MNFGLKFLKLSLWAMVLSSGLVGCRAELGPASQRSRDELQNQTMLLLRHKACVEDQQYQSNGLCCLNCQAGSFVRSPCIEELKQGQCDPCEDGSTYTEHSNGMSRCLPCTHCRRDQIQTMSCTSTGDTQCLCQQGTFCVPEQACEVCKRCAKCKASEEEVAKCTSTSNTVCQKLNVPPTAHPPAPPTPAPSSPGASAILVVLLLLLVLVPTGVGSGSHSHSGEIVKIAIDESGPTAEEQQNNQNAGLEGEEARPEFRPLLQETQAGLSKASPPPLEDEDRGLGDSLPNTTSSSQTSLSALPTAASSSSSPRHSPVAARLQPTAGDDPLQKKLVPRLGEEKSLKKSFDLFEEHLDVRIHNKFFRRIGVSDNHIRLAESALPGDKVYDLLKNWMQREGLKADINTLLDALLGLDQRRSAESIAFAAIHKGYYKHADDTP